METYKTDLIDIAAALALQFPYTWSRMENSKRVEFIFTGNDVNKVKDSIIFGDLLVEPRNYFIKIKELKSLTYHHDSK